MTDKAPPGRQPDRPHSPQPEADLDADLWPSPPSPPEEVPLEPPVRVPPWLRAMPAADSPAGLVAYNQPGSGPEPAPDDAPVLDARPPERGLAGLFREPPVSPGARLTEPTPPVRPARHARSQVATAPRMPARDRLRLEREREARKRRRRIRVVAVVTGLTVLVAAGAVATLLRHHGSAPKIVQVGSRFAGPYAPVTISSDSVTMARPGVSKPVLDVYEDFQCPPCRAFERANGGVIQQLAALGKIKVVYHLFTIFSGQPELADSTRAWAAAKCAPADKWVAYHNALFGGQPALTAVGGFPVGQLLQLGRNVGITSQGFASCVQSQRYAAQDATVSSRVIGNGPDGLPTLRLNGQLLTLSPASAGLHRKLVAAAS
jgi:protein-disulfide isomerase